jgi:hypothetical protein
MARGKKPGVDGLAALPRWSGLRAETFVITAPQEPRRKPETLAMICSRLPDLQRTELAIKGVLPKPIDLLEFQRILSSPTGRTDRARAAG